MILIVNLWLTNDFVWVINFRPGYRISLVFSFIFLLSILFPIIIMFFIPIFKIWKSWLISIVTWALIKIFIFPYIVFDMIMVEVWAINWKNMTTHLWIIYLDFIIQRWCHVLSSSISHFLNFQILFIFALIFEKILLIVFSFLETIIFFFFLSLKLSNIILILFSIISLRAHYILWVLRWNKIYDSISFIFKNNLFPSSENGWNQILHIFWCEL